MKKLLAILLTLMLVLVNVAALAEDGNNQDDTQTDAKKVVSIDPSTANTAGNPTKEATVTIKKSINVTSLAEADKHPAVTLKFTVTSSSVALSTVTSAPAITFKDLTIAEGANEGNLEIKLPSYSAVGVYTYNVTETPLNYAGYTEATNLEVKVTVIQNGENLEVAGIAVRQNNVKTDNIVNTYEAGGLKVTKTVHGTMGDRTKAFPITITLNAPTGKTVKSTVTSAVTTSDGTTTSAVTFNNSGVATVTVNLKHNEYVVISNLPAGVTYTVVEGSTIKHLDAADEDQTNANAYFVEGEVTTAKTIAAKTQSSETIKNTKTIDVDTGVALDFVPYVLIMALALAGVALRIYRRREDY